MAVTKSLWLGNRDGQLLQLQSVHTLRVTDLAKAFLEVGKLNFLWTKLILKLVICSSIYHQAQIVRNHILHVLVLVTH